MRIDAVRIMGIAMSQGSALKTKAVGVTVGVNVGVGVGVGVALESTEVTVNVTLFEVVICPFCVGDLHEVHVGARNCL